MRRWPIFALAVLVTGCTPVTRPKPPVTSAELLSRAHEEGLDLQDPLAIDEEMKKAVDKVVPRFEPELYRVRNLKTYIRSTLDFEYATNVSLTAKEAFRQRRGDCMAFTHLFVALARYLELDAYFVHVNDVRNFYERKGSFFVSSHVAAGVGKGPAAMVVDFAKEISDWRLSIYEGIDDAAAVALYYNNVAMDDMLSGRSWRAEKMMRFLMSSQPNVPEIYNNLGVILNRREQYKEALEVIQTGLVRFPSYEPLYTNGIRAARGAAEPAIEAELDKRGRELADQDPYFLLARGEGLYRDKHFDESVQQLERASSVKPDSVTIWAWLSRAYFAVGKHDSGMNAYHHARKISPDAPVVRELVEQFPELKVAD